MVTIFPVVVLYRGRAPYQTNTRNARDAMCTSVRENVGLLLDLVNQSEPREDLRANELVVELIANVRYVSRVLIHVGHRMTCYFLLECYALIMEHSIPKTKHW
jgi:hypothetical protein